MPLAERIKLLVHDGRQAATSPPRMAVQKLARMPIFELRVCTLTVQDAQLAYKHRGLLCRVHPWTQT